MPEQVIRQFTVYDIPFLTVRDLSKKDTLELIKDFVTYVIIPDSDNEAAWKLRNKLRSLLDKSKSKLDPSLAKEYENQLVLASFVDLAGLTDREIENLFRSKVLFAIRNGVDILREVQSYPRVYMVPEISVNFANLVMRALGYNQEKLGDFDIYLEGEKRPVEPTVSNWLRNYNQFFTTTQRRGPVEEGEFLLKNRNVARLNEEDHEVLIKLLQLYDFLRFPDQFTRGPFRIQKLKTDKLPPPSIPEVTTLAPPSPPLKQEILAAYQGDPRQQNAILKEEQKLQKKFKDDTTKLRQEFFGTVQKKNINRTIALLRLLAQKNDLQNFIKEDEKLNKFLAAIWEKQYGQQLADDFRENPTQVRFLRLFLQYILQQRLEMSESDAARLGLQVGNILASLGQKEYNKMAYFDVPSKSFRWFT